MVIKRTNQLTGPRIRPAQGVTQTYFFLTRNICIHLILNQLNMSCVLFFQSFIYRTLQIWLLFTVLFIFHPCKRVLSFFSSRTGCGFLNNVNESCQSGVSVICHRSQRAPWRLWNVDSFQCGDFPLHLFRKKKEKEYKWSEVSCALESCEGCVWSQLSETSKLKRKFHHKCRRRSRSLLLKVHKTQRLGFVCRGGVTQLKHLNEIIVIIFCIIEEGSEFIWRMHRLVST